MTVASPKRPPPRLPLQPNALFMLGAPGPVSAFLEPAPVWVYVPDARAWHEKVYATLSRGPTYKRDVVFTADAGIIVVLNGAWPLDVAGTSDAHLYYDFATYADGSGLVRYDARGYVLAPGKEDA